MRVGNRRNIRVRTTLGAILLSATAFLWTACGEHAGHRDLTSGPFAEAAALKIPFTVDLPTRTATGRTILVRPGPDHSASAIQKAIDTAGPGDVIFLEPGLYLWHPEDSSDTPPEPPVLLKNIENLTLRSDGDAYVFSTDRASMPLELFSARKILIENVHFGHAGVLGYTCTASTVWLYDSQDVTFRRCVLHGSGQQAVAGWKNKRIALEGCALARGTSAAVDLSFTDGFLVRSSYFADNGSDPRGSCLLDLTVSRDFYFLDNLFDRNHSACFHHLDRTKAVFFRGNVLYANRFTVDEDAALPGPNAVLPATPGADVEHLERSALWPDRDVKTAAKRYRAFRAALKRAELEIH